MLINFSVGNFLSFNDIQTLSMLPEGLKERKENLHIPYLFDSNVRVLKSVSIFGHNSYGKTNFIKAFNFFRACIFSSFSFGKIDGHIDVDYFKLNEKGEKKPTFFEIVFLIRETKYRYSFEISNGKIFRECLWYSSSKIRENFLFERVGDETKLSKVWVKEGGNKISQSLIFTKSHNLFLSVLMSQEKIARVDEISNWFKSNIIIEDLADKAHIEKALLILSQPKYRNIVQNFISSADLGFKTIIDKIDSYSRQKLELSKEFLNLYFSHELNTFEIYTQHDVYDDNRKLIGHKLFELLKNESAGSIKFLILSCYLTFAIKEGYLILIDELEAKLHVHLLKTIIEIFNNNKINVSGAQLLFTSHSTAILSEKLLRRDQMFYMTKSDFGESILCKMHTPENPIRLDSSMEKNYLKGRLGGSSKSIGNNLNLLFNDE